MRLYSCVIAVVALAALSSLTWAQPSFQGLGLHGGDSSHARAVSGDGTTVVGWIDAGAERHAYRWRDSEFTFLGDLPGGSEYSKAYGVSPDGSRVVGDSVSRGSCSEAFLWRDGTMFGLGGLCLHCCSISFAVDVSADGNVVVGYGPTPFPGIRPFLWNAGVIERLALNRDSVATGVSSDGTVIVGGSPWGFSAPAFRWDDGVVTDLAVSAPGCSFALATDVSADGTIAVGYDSCGYFIRWERTNYGVALGRGAGVTAGGNPLTVSCSADGRVIVGGRFIWYPTVGMLNLQEVLTDRFAVDLAGWDLMLATSVSGDGLVIVGDGINPAGQTEGWMVRLPPEPVAVCRDVSKQPGAECLGSFAPEEVNGRSFDPNGGDLVLTMKPAGPLPIGSHNVTLTIQDAQTLFATCNAMVTVIDTDTDNDGVCGQGDNCPEDPNTNQADNDSDGVGDVCDLCWGFDDAVDPDRDGVPDGCDACPGTPLGALTDERGCAVPYGACCFQAGPCINDVRGNDCALVGGNYIGDGLNCGSDPDNDGVVGCKDGCPLDPEKVVPGFCGCGVPEGDRDGDGACDTIDPCPLDDPDDSDSDGVCDSLDPCPLDNPDDTDDDGACNSDDGCPDDPDKIEPGACGCGVADDDGDGDQIADCDDICPQTPGGSDVNRCGCPVGGSCCFAAGVCFDRVDADDCATIGGVYQGDGSTCLEGCGFGDLSGDGTMDLVDFAVFQQCFGSVETVWNETCAGADVDHCRSIDLFDFVAFLRALTGP